MRLPRPQTVSPSVLALALIGLVVGCADNAAVDVPPAAAPPFPTACAPPMPCAPPTMAGPPPATFAAPAQPAVTFGPFAPPPALALQTAYTPPPATVPLPPPAPATRESGSPKRPVGTWERECGPYRFTLRIEADKLHGVMTAADRDRKVTIALDADYSLTKDSVLYGVVTGVQVTGREREQDEAEAIAYVDLPFSVRVRQDDNTLTIKGVKFLDLGTDKNDLKEFGLIQGRYKKRAEARTAQN